MKRGILVVAFLLGWAGGLAAPARAADPTLAVGAGIGLPQGDLGNAVDTGYLGGATFDLPITKDYSLGAEASYVRWGDANETVMGFSTLPVTVHGRYLFPSEDGKMRTYAQVAAGLYRNHWTHSVVTGTDQEGNPTYRVRNESSSDFGWNAGFGATWPMAHGARWGLEALYHGTTLGSGGGSANFLTFTASYHWGVKQP